MDEKKPRFRSTFYFEGKQYECRGKDQKEADKKAALKEAALKKGEVGISSNMTVEKWTNEWFETYKKPSIGASTAGRYLRFINNQINPAIGNLKLNQVKDIHLQKILNARAGYSKDNLSKLKITIESIFKRAYISKLIPFNPAENLELPAASQSGSHRSITPYERCKILDLCETHSAGLLVKTLLYCGLRPGEAIALDWRNVDFEKQILHVISAVKAETNIIGEPKSAAGKRDIPIPDMLINDLLLHKQGPFEPIFTQPTTGKRHTQKSVHDAWNNFKRALDVSMGAKVYRNKIIISTVAIDLVPYCLRHTYCTDLQDAGVPINVARYLMGHADIKMTSRIYTHTTDKALKDAADKINAYDGLYYGQKNENAVN